jgi:hypothetical protein
MLKRSYQRIDTSIKMKEASIMLASLFLIEDNDY